MKSLEIVNKLSKATWYDQETDALITYISKDMLNQIKQDLEVLEILRKYLFIEKYVDSWFEIDLYELHHKEDFHKVKQWLEENENDR